MIPYFHFSLFPCLKNCFIVYTMLLYSPYYMDVVSTLSTRLKLVTKKYNTVLNLLNLDLYITSFKISVVVGVSSP